MADLTVIWRLEYPHWQWGRLVNNDVIFLVQSKIKDEQKNPKDLYGIKMRKRLSKREEGMQRNVLDPTSWKEEVYLDVGYPSCTSQFDF